MILLGKTLVSEELLEEAFVCNLSACKGECCVQGDAGAPLDPEETIELEGLLPVMKDYLPEDGYRALEEEGAWTIDVDGDLVTPLVKGTHCAYTVFEDGVAGCGIERAWKDGKTQFRKPISCHLYPIRISNTRYYEALNYHRWEVCSAACSLGQQLSVPVYRFLREALVRKYGAAWFNELEEVAQDYSSKK